MSNKEDADPTHRAQTIDNHMCAIHTHFTTAPRAAPSTRSTWQK